MLSSPASNETTGEVAEALTAYDDKLNPIPRLAESWEWSSDNTKIKLNLREGVTFHSGREFTSDDVKYNILRARDPSNGFAAVEWVQGDHILMQRNTNYWDPDLPRVDEYFVQIFRDQQSMVAALESGTLDVAALAPIPDAVRLKDDPNYQVVSTNDVGQYFYATVNTGVAPTDNKLLRQAIGYAINRQRFADSVMRGFVGKSRDLPWTTTSPAFEDSKNSFYTYDLEKARSLAQQSGVSNPEFDIAWATAGFSAEYQQLAQIIQSDLAQIGVKTNLKPQEPPQFTAVGTAEPDANKRKQLYSQINDLLLDSAYCFTVSADANIMALRANVRGLRFEPSTFVTVREMWLRRATSPTNYWSGPVREDLPFSRWPAKWRS